jgi:hypothetical protein
VLKKKDARDTVMEEVQVHDDEALMEEMLSGLGKICIESLK